MMVIPSVDIINGKAVRLYKGSFDEATIYPTSPLDMAKGYADIGYTFIHIVNLDRANSIVDAATESMIEQICSLPYLQIQMGGGMRSAQAVKEASDLGVRRFVIGTLAIDDAETTRSLVRAYGKERFTFSFDVEKEGEEYFIKTEAWKKKTTSTLFEKIEEYKNEIDYLACTDIDKDGSLAAPNFELYHRIKAAYPSLFLQASGGISSEEDIDILEENRIDAAIIGKAIYEKKVDLKSLYRQYNAR